MGLLSLAAAPAALPGWVPTGAEQVALDGKYSSVEKSVVQISP